jgi:hypothetical protein
MSRGGLKLLWDEAHVWIFSGPDSMNLVASSHFPSYVSIFIKKSTSAVLFLHAIVRIGLSVNGPVYLKQSINSISSTCLTFQILKDSHCVL